MSNAWVIIMKRSGDFPDSEFHIVKLWQGVPSAFGILYLRTLGRGGGAWPAQV